MQSKNFFPDGVTEIDNWFNDCDEPKLSNLGRPYKLTDYGVKADGSIQTEAIQALIDKVSKEGGGVIVVPSGVFLTGALFIKPGVNIYIEKDGMLKGSDDINDYPVLDTRIEGQSCKYFSALINADKVDGFTLCGEGCVDGNGLRAWKSFWLRRTWNPDCTNKDEQRARLIYISNSKDVTVSGLTIRNAQFWSNHIYKCERVKYLNCTIESPSAPVEAPSTDALDIDVSRKVLVKGCHMSVNDDAVVLKGGKGLGCDIMPENGPSEEIIVEDCTFGFCHSCVTFGSECIHGKNLIVRNCKSYGARDFLRFKMRPDTPQLYEDVLVENIEDTTYCFLDIKAWTQFYEGNDRENPKSYVKNVAIRKCKGSCMRFFDVTIDERQFEIEDFFLEKVDFEAVDTGLTADVTKNVKFEQTDIKVDPDCEASKLAIDTAKIM